MQFGRSIPALAASLLALALLAPSPHAAGPSTNPRDWVGDVRFLSAAMDTIHPQPYLRHSRQEWAAAAARLEQRLPHLNYQEAVAGFARLAALAADGHTRMDHVHLQNHNNPQLALLPGPGFDGIYPFQCEIFTDGLFIVGAPPENASLLGQRILEFNGVPTAAVVDSLRAYISADNEMWILNLAPEYLHSPAYLEAAGICRNLGDSVRLTLITAEGARSETVLRMAAAPSRSTWVDLDAHAGATGAKPLYRRLTDNFAFVDLGGSPHTVYVRLNAIQDIDTVNTMERFSERVFSYLDSAGVERLVLDARRNGGGDNYLNQPLIHGLICNKRVNRPGRLFMIVDRGTFSAAVGSAGLAPMDRARNPGIRVLR